MELDNEIKKLLINTKEYIMHNDFDAAYEYVSKNTSSHRDVASYTSCLLQAGVDPLKYMDRVPVGYLYFAKNPSLTIEVPEHIGIIDDVAFKEASLDKVIIRGTPQINYQVFSIAQLTIVCNDEVKEDILSDTRVTSYLKFETL